MVIVFIGITFLMKAVIFISLALSRNKTLLHYDNYSSQTLLMEFISLSVDGGGMMMINYHISISTTHLYYSSSLSISTIHLYYPSNLSLPPHIHSEEDHFRLRSHRNSISSATRENRIQDSSGILHPEL